MFTSKWCPKNFLNFYILDRARIRVEHIIREDYLVEGLEIAEMFLDLLLARVGLIQISNDIDPGMTEAISSVIWVQPRKMEKILFTKKMYQKRQKNEMYKK